MDWIIAHAEVIGALSGAGLAAWGFFAKLDNTYRAHLKDEFATKSDFHRLEDKIDSVLIAAFGRAKAKRRVKRTKTVA